MRALHLALFVSVSLSLSAARIASAQFIGGGAPGPKFTLVMMPDVQKELKVTGDQKKQIQAAMQDMGSGQMTMDMSTMNDQMDAKMLAPLNPDQLSRLNELWMQYEGPRVLQDKAVAESLKLPDDVTAKIKDIWDEYQTAFLDAMKNAHSNSAFNAVKKMKTAADVATLALLSDDQNKAFKDLEGKAFKFQMKKRYLTADLRSRLPNGS